MKDEKPDIVEVAWDREVGNTTIGGGMKIDVKKKVISFCAKVGKDEISDIIGSFEANELLEQLFKDGHLTINDYNNAKKALEKIGNIPDPLDKWLQDDNE